MSDNSKATTKSADVLVDMLQQMNQSLQLLVGLGESLLDTLERSSATADIVSGKASSPASAPRSADRSARSENSTNAGVFDLSEEDIISFAQASAMVPVNPHPSVSTISRWCTQGCRGIRLGNIYIGGRRKTTSQAVDRFLAACRRQGWAGMHDNAAS